MTKKDLFLALIKVFGLYQFIAVLFSLPQVILMIFYDDDYKLSGFIIAIQVILLAVIIVAIIKAEYILKLLQLEKGFDTIDIDMKGISKYNIIALGSFILGGLILVNNLPGLVLEIFYIMKQELGRKSFVEIYQFNPVQFSFYLGRSIFGGFLLFSYSKVATFLGKRF